MKLMAVVPQAKIGMSYVKIDGTAATHMVKDIYRDTAEYDSNMSEEDHWAMLFNMDKVNRLESGRPLWVEHSHRRHRCLCRIQGDETQIGESSEEECAGGEK